MTNRTDARAPYASLLAFCGDLTHLVTTGSRSPETINAVKDLLSGLIGLAPELPESVRRPAGEEYARHLLYRHPDGLFEIVVMAWAPGQRTPVHDHAGIWCVEGVVQGAIEVTRYDLRGSVGDHAVLMKEVDVIRAGLGQCGALIPPVEYHRIANPFDSLALTMHIYGGLMTQCRVFEPAADGAWHVTTRQLRYVRPEPALPA